VFCLHTTGCEQPRCFLPEPAGTNIQVFFRLAQISRIIERGGSGYRFVHDRDNDSRIAIVHHASRFLIEMRRRWLR
jgi:hypothetical protein